jgi:predicted nuclease with TOPRIM domain
MEKPTKVKYDENDDECESDDCRSDNEEDYSKDELIEICEQLSTGYEKKRKKCKALQKELKALKQSFDELQASHECLKEDHEELEQIFKQSLDRWLATFVELEQNCITSFVLLIKLL